MTASLNAETSLLFSELAYRLNTGGFPTGTVIPDGFELATDILDNGFLVDSDTGLRVVVLRNNTTNQLVVTFAGTDSVQDVYQDIRLGWPQWEAAKNDGFLEALKAIDHTATEIHFTGHSLGGALAQYAAYEYFNDVQGEITNGALDLEIGITTFNALGGEDGLEQNLPDIGESYEQGLLSQFDDNIKHYYVDGDLVSSLGGGHVGGKTFVLKNTGKRVEAYLNLLLNSLHKMRSRFRIVSMPEVSQIYAIMTLCHFNRLH